MDGGKEAPPKSGRQSRGTENSLGSWTARSARRVDGPAVWSARRDSPTSRHRLHLIGPFKLVAPDGARIRLPSKKGIALIAMLATGRDGERTRKWLQDRLWGSRSPPQAQSSLRRELSNLRELLGAFSPALLAFENDCVRIPLEAVALDFPGDLRDLPPDAELPPGELLEGLDIPGEEGFEDWLREQRGILAESRRTLASARASAAERGRKSNGTPADRAAIAVGPFENLSGRPGLADLLATLVEGLIDRFARLRWLRVASTSQAVSAAQYWLQGSTRLEGDRAVLFLTLIDREPGRIVLTHQVDLAGLATRDARTDFAATLVSALGAQIDNLEQLAARSRPDAELTLRDLIFRGRWHFNRITQDDAKKAAEYFRRALSHDPDSTEALVHLAWVKARSIWVQRLGADEMKEVRRLAQRIMNLDGDDSRGYMLAGLLELWLRNTSRAKALLAQSIALNPSLPMVHANLGSAYNLSGAPDLAIAHLERTLQLAPADHEAFYVFGEMAMAYALLGEWERAIDHAEGWLARRGAYWYAHMLKVHALVRSGKTAAAAAALRDLKSVTTGFSETYLDWIPFEQAACVEPFKQSIAIAASIEPADVKDPRLTTAPPSAPTG